MANRFRIFVEGKLVVVDCVRCQNLSGRNDNRISIALASLFDRTNIKGMFAYFSNHNHGATMISPLDDFKKLIEQTATACETNAERVYTEMLQEALLKASGG